jgi:chaperonin GroES
MADCTWQSDKEENQTMKTNITPLHDRLIVKRIDEGEQIRGGIIIPDSAKEKPQEGEVLAVGEGKYRKDGTRQPLDVKKGDRVLFGKYSSSEIKIDGQELLIMREDEILGIITRAGTAVSGNKGLR